MEELLFRQTAHGAALQTYTGASASVTVPDEWNGLPVTEIGDYAFSGCAALRTVTLPKGLEIIGDHAFYNCRALERLTLQKGPRSVGNGAFMNCYQLHDLYIQGLYGIRGLVMDFSNELTMHITPPDGAPFLLLFPEYDYSYEETLPRGIMSVTYGSGSFYRACVMLQTIQFADYDREFKRAMRMDEPQTVRKIAFYRLLYPYHLRPAFEQAYAAFLKEHAADAASDALRARSIPALTLLLTRELLSREALETAICQAAELDFPEAVSLLMDHRITRFGKAKRRFVL